MSPKRFYLLEIIRALALFKVILFHWSHFFSSSLGTGVRFSRDQMPLFEILYIFYLPSHVAIPFFFCVSGFIFFWLYSTRVAQRTITSKSFFINRLSRLYPLHFVTLMAVVIGQIIYAKITNIYYVYAHNDIYHFILNLFLAPAWGLEQGFSFNGPVWLVSVQVLMYSAFFIFCRLFYRNLFALFVVVMVGCFVPIFGEFVEMGITYFFLGGIIFIVYERIIKIGDPWKVSAWLPWVTAACWLLTLLFANPHMNFTLNVSSSIQAKIFIAWQVFILLPSTILSMTLLETKKGPIGKSLSWIGDATYSIYLLHFPLQLIIAIMIVKGLMDQAFFFSVWSLPFFFLVLILLSLASRRFFETPIQNYLRLHFDK